jgi:serine/threonine-protein kinase
MLSFTGEVKLIDFGIAKVIGDSSLTQARMVVGRPIFTAPEAIAGGEADRRSDIYSLGVVLWMMLTGRYFPDIFEQGIAPAPSSSNGSVGDRLDAVCLRAIAVRPDERYQSAEELLDALVGLPGVAPMYDRKVAAFLSDHFDIEQERRQLARDVAGAQDMLGEPTILAAPPEPTGEVIAAPDAQPMRVEPHTPKRGVPLALGVVLGAGAAALVAWSSWPSARQPPPQLPICPLVTATTAAAAPIRQEKPLDPPVPVPEPAPVVAAVPLARAERRPARGPSRKSAPAAAPVFQPDAGELLRDATAQLKAGAFDRAFELANAAAQAGAGAPAHLIMGKAFFAKSDLPRAETEFRKVAALRPNDAEAASFLEVIRKAGGRGP